MDRMRKKIPPLPIEVRFPLDRDPERRQNYVRLEFLFLRTLNINSTARRAAPTGYGINSRKKAVKVRDSSSAIVTKIQSILSTSSIAKT
jgi:hypothetical protein